MEQQRAARETRPLSLIEDPKLLKAPKASWGPRVQEEQGYVILGFRVPTTSVGLREQGSEGNKGYVILGFRVPTISGGGR